ncbi:MAG: SRPBCC family protein [Gammaproteobacteria bacterium]|nr:SRPBCC family protein [Gammaproteobacteria bacterium]
MKMNSPEVHVKKNTILFFSIFLFCAGIAQAHGPTRQKVIVKEQISTTPEAVWEVVKNFNDMSWHPAFVKTEGENGNSIGAKRVLTLANGGKIYEILDKYDSRKHSFFYRIEHVDVKVLPVTNYSSWFSVTPSGDGGSTVTWKGAFYRGYPNNDPPPELSDQAAVEAVTGAYRGGLSNLKKLLEHGS